MIFNNANLACAFSRRPRNMSLKYGQVKDSIDNRKNFLSGLGIDYQDLICARQIHGSGIKFAEEKDRGSGALSDDNAIADTDALVTDKANLPLAIFTADCLPVFLYDPYNHAIGLIHAGWKGSKDNISAKTVRAMQEKFNTLPMRLYAGFGPAIRACCYEVSGEFNNYFIHGLTQRDKRYYLDLIEINKKQIVELGVKEKNITDSKNCTSCCNQDFFSVRREGTGCGRIMSVMMLKDKRCTL